MRAPFRIGTTSFLYPESWLGNVLRLAGRVDDVEILVFEPEWPESEEMAALARVKREAGLTYTLHTPLGLSLASESEARRRTSVDVLRRVIEGTAPLEPDAYVVHVYLGDREGDPPPRDLGGWRRRARTSLEAVLEAGVASAAVCVETLDYDFRLLEPVVEELGLSVALDLGHHYRDGRATREALARVLPRARIVQWHGVDASGRDHRSLVHVPRREARAVLDLLLAESFGGVLTLEVFREEDFEESLALLSDLLAESTESGAKAVSAAAERAEKARNDG